MLTVAELLAAYLTAVALLTWLVRFLVKARF